MGSVHSEYSEFFRNNVTAIILRSIYDEDRYGYEILQEIDKKTAGKYKIKQATLYSCLKRLEQKGLVSSYFGEESKGGIRRYFHLTDEGRDFVEKSRQEYEFSRTLLNNLLSDRDFDLEEEDAPFEINDVRPATKRSRISKESLSDEYAAEAGETAADEINEDIEIIAAEVQPVDLEPEPIADEVGRINAAEPSAEETLQADVPDPSPLSTGVFTLETVYRSEADNIKTVAVNKLKRKWEEEYAEKYPQYAVGYDMKAVYPHSADYHPGELIGDKEYKHIDFDYIHVLEDNAVYESKQNAFFEEKVSLAREIYDTVYAPAGANIKFKNVAYGESGARDILGMEDPDDLYAVSAAESRAKAKKLLFERETVAADNSDGETDIREIIQEDKPELAVTETESVNYKNVLSNILSKNEEEDAQGASYFSKDAEYQKNRPIERKDFAILKSDLNNNGYNVRSYDKGNTASFYAKKYVYANKILRDCSFITFLVLGLELLALYFGFNSGLDIAPSIYIVATLFGLAYPILTTILYIGNPKKRIKAAFNFKKTMVGSLIFAGTAAIVAIVTALLFKADCLICAVIIPFLFIIDVPLNFVIYSILYKTGKYYLS